RKRGSGRTSVTDECNVRCTYCMPGEGLEWLRRDEILSFEEIARLTSILAALGVGDVRLTGGEPLVRRDMPELVRMLGSIPGVEDLSLTTNGILLERLAGPLVKAGLQRINVSLDSLDHLRFAEITRRDALDQVLAGLAEAERYPELRPIKVNCVAIKGFTEDAVPALGELGFVNPVSEPFCSSCDRIRVTADGQLRTCLFSRREWDLKTALRDGRSDSQIADFLRFAIRHKELKHHVNEPGFVPASRSMSQIG